VGVVKLDDHSLMELGALTYMCKPKQLPLPPKIIEITGIKSEDLADKKAFAYHLPDLMDFFLGERVVVGHFVNYDMDMLGIELARLALQRKFPWPMRYICTVEENMELKGYKLKQDILYEIATGKKPEGAHRALNDVRNLSEILRWMRSNNRF
jgi:DNA polymerase III epsilon subunit-like protein